MLSVLRFPQIKPCLIQLTGNYTLFKDIHVLKFQQVVTIIIISHINLVVLSHWVFHPGTFITPVHVVCDGFCDCGQRVFAFPCKQDDSLL